MKFTEKTQKINVWFFSNYLVPMNPGDVLVIGEWTLLQLGNVTFFRFFSKCQKSKLRKIHEKNQFLSFPNIFISNEARGRASHWGMNFSGIGQCQIFLKFFSKCPKWNYREKPKKINFWVFQLYLVQMNPRDVLVIGEWTLLELGNVRCFRNFSKGRNWTGKTFD